MLPRLIIWVTPIYLAVSDTTPPPPLDAADDYTPTNQPERIVQNSWNISSSSTYAAYQRLSGSHTPWTR